MEMHAIQTSGNCIRNTTSDQFAAIAPDEIEDPRPWCEIIRQWSTLHPEFAFLPRKFKIAVSGSQGDRAAILVHDIGLQLVKNDQGQIGFTVYVGGGLGRTPVIGQAIKEFLPWQHLLTYLNAILRGSGGRQNAEDRHSSSGRPETGEIWARRERFLHPWSAVLRGVEVIQRQHSPSFLKETSTMWQPYAIFGCILPDVNARM